MKKNIAFFNIYKIWGGGEKWHFEMALNLKKKGHNVYVFSPEEGEFSRRANENGLGVKYINWSKYSYFNPIRIISLALIFRRLNVDILLYNSFLDVREAGLSAFLAGINRKIFRIGMPISPKRKLFNKLSFSLGIDVINFISKDIFSVFKRDVYSFIRGKKHFFLTNGINPELFTPRLSQPCSKVIVGNCVRLSKQKGLKYFIEVANNFKDRDNIEFVIGGDGEQKDELERLVKSYGLSEKVKFAGFQENPEDFMNNIDILLFTSEFEGTARTVIEGLFCEKPVVCFDISSMKELIEHGQDGFKVEPFNLDIMSSSLEKLIYDQPLREKMGKNGRRKALREYDIREIRKEWEKVILE